MDNIASKNHVILQYSLMCVHTKYNPEIFFTILFKSFEQHAPGLSSWGSQVLENELTTLCPECSATGMGQFPICKQKWDLLRTSVTACTIDENTFFAPFGIFYVRTEIWKEIFQKKSCTNP